MREVNDALAVVAAIIRNERGEILLAQRPPGKEMAGSWEFPGGKIEPGESAVEALHRELREELELDVRMDRELGEFTHVYPWGRIALRVFVVTALTSPRPTGDVEVFRWARAETVDPAELTPADRPALDHFLRPARPATE
jgi:8-oxo-dGTP diphosphatase